MTKRIYSIHYPSLKDATENDRQSSAHIAIVITDYMIG
jgi:hypothetical protein